MTRKLKELNFDSLDLISKGLKDASKPQTQEEIVARMKKAEESKTSGVVSIIDRVLPTQKIQMKRKQEADKLKLRLKLLNQAEGTEVSEDPEAHHSQLSQLPKDSIHQTRKDQKDLKDDKGDKEG